MIFKVNYSQDKDVWNYLNSCWKFTYPKHGRKKHENKLLAPYPEKFKETLSQAKTESHARKIITDFLDSFSQNYKNTTLVIAKGVEAVLNENKREIVSELEKLYANPFPFDKIEVFLTTVNINPYNYEERWFMSGRNASIQGHIRTAKHELNHFMFYYYFPHLKKELGSEKYEQLKEALAIFTNPEGNDKPAIKKLEKFLKSQKGAIPQIMELLRARGIFWNS